jgi:hypothetical protein
MSLESIYAGHIVSAQFVLASDIEAWCLAYSRYIMIIYYGRDLQ